MEDSLLKSTGSETFKEGMQMLKLTSVCPSEGLVTLHSFLEGGLAFCMMYAWRYLRDVDVAHRNMALWWAWLCCTSGCTRSWRPSPNVSILGFCNFVVL